MSLLTLLPGVRSKIRFTPQDVVVLSALGGMPPHDVLFVHSGTGSNASGNGTKESPLASLDYAVGRCTASKGDVIVLLPGHTETLSSATALALDVAGVDILGLGQGSLRPTFTLDTATTTTIGVTAANVSLSNCIFTANFADIVAFFTLTNAPNFRLQANLFKATATNMNCKYLIDTDTTSNHADNLSLIGNTWIDPDAATISMCKVDGTNDGWVILDNYVSVAAQASGGSMLVIASGKVLTNVQVEGNRCRFIGGDLSGAGVVFTTDGSTNSGHFSRNYIQHTDTASEIFGTASSGFSFFENRMSGVAGATGYVLPAVDS